MEGGDCRVSSIEERIVRMKWDGAQFSAGVDATLRKIESLNSAMKFDGAAAGLNQVQSNLNSLSTDPAQQSVNGLASRFTALQAAAFAAISNIVNRVVDAGLQIAKSLTLEPVMKGFSEYETNLTSIQTTLANTGLKGADGLAKVNGALDELNHYSDQTIYNFSEMAKNIGTFTAAGLSLDTSTAAIKGIANLAAISGSNSQQASAAMYQLSQALSAGKVSLEDWNSVVNAGMGGKVFQDSLIETARAHGVAVDSLIKKHGSFRLSLQEGWITSDILAQTLSKFTGDLTADQLKSMGYNQQQIAGIMEMGQTATDAATKVKTMTQLLDTLREGVGSGWSKTWSIIFGNFDEARELFTGVNNVLGKMVGNSADARNNLLQGWKDLGGRDALIQGIANAFHALMSILKPIKDAFREIFPATTAEQLVKMSVAFRDFMERMKLGEQTANNLRRTFAGFFAILGIGWELIKAGVGFIFDLVGSLTKGSGGFLKFTGGIGDFLVALHQAIKSGDAFGKVFDAIAKVLQVPINLIQKLVGLFGNLFKGTGDSAGQAQAAVGNLVQSLNPLQKLGAMVSGAWERILQIFSNIASKVQQVAKSFIDWAKNVGDGVGGIFDGFNAESILKGINVGLFATLLVMLNKFVGDIADIFVGNDGIFSGIVDALEGLTGALNGMQHALNAAALLLIAAAVGILTISLVNLAKIDQAGLIRASVAIGVMFTQLSLAFMAFNKISTGGSALKVGVMAAGLILLATAVVVLSHAVERLSGIPIEELRKGLIALVILITTLVAASNRLDTNTSGMIRTAAGLVVLGLAIRVLVESVEELGKLDWNSLAKGLVGVATLLASLALFTKFADANKGGMSQGLGIILLATGLKILASAVGDFVQFNWEQLARGMSGVAVGLGLITAAMNLIPQGAIAKAAGVAIIGASLQLIASGVEKMSALQWDEIARGMTVLAGSLISISLALRLIPAGSMMNAAAVLVVAASLHILQSALGKMGEMSWEEIGKGLAVLAASLILIAGALRIMQGSLSGSAALVVAALALNLLVPVLTTLGEMSWEEIIKGLAGLAGVFLVVGVAGLLLGPLAPVIFSLAGGIALLGAAVLAAGVGVLAFAIGLGLLAAAGAGAVAAIVGIVSGLVGLIPYVMEQIGLGLIAFANVIATAGPSILSAITTVLNALLQAIIDVTPKAVEALVVMLTGLLDALVRSVPKMVDAGMKIIIGFLKGIADNIGKVVDQGARIIVEFLNGLGRNVARVVQAGIDLVISFINAIADGIRNNSVRMADAGWNIASALVEGVIKGIGQLVKRAVDAALNLAKSMWNGMMDFLGIASPSKKMIWLGKQLVLGGKVGIDDYGYMMVDAAVAMGGDVLNSFGKTLGDLGSVIGGDLDELNPTITPVLDLSQVRKDALTIEDIFNMPSFNVSGTYDGARAAASGYEENRTATDSSDTLSAGSESYWFTQINNSPKALPAAEIYRQTNNLISQQKGGNRAP